MSASFLMNITHKSNFYRNLRNFSCALSRTSFHANEPVKSQCTPGNYSMYLVPKAYCKFSTVPTKKPEITKNVISHVKIDDESSRKEDVTQGIEEIPSKKLGLFARFKLMYKQYWYVLIPVHVLTSIGWFGGFYYLSKSGVDVATLLQSIHISDNIIDKVKASDMGHVAIAYLLYKIATPVRYAVTLGGTTFFINYLCQLGYIKPVPSKDQLLKMYENKKADIAKRKQGKLERKVGR